MSCDLTLLQRSLDERLTEAEEEALSLHLTGCEACQRALEQLAGQPAAWMRVGTVLRDSSCVTGAAPTFLSAASDNPIDQEAAVDFAVECLEPSTSPESIGRLGDIEILEVIGQGGFGVVLKGYQPELKRLVAVKVLAPQLAVSAPARKRFAREAQATAAILHSNVMPILTVHSSGKLPYIVMPYVACESLQQRIDRTGPLELVDILRIGMQTANGLAAAHAQGLVHRDVKPANILLEIGIERVMLTDFGLARAIDDASITRTGVIAGTPLYMSPEQARGEVIDARSDLFSLGSVLYTLATGRPPFRAESTYGILRRLTDDAPRPLREISPQFPNWFAMIVHKLLSKQPGERFVSAGQVAQTLEQCLAHVQQPTAVELPELCRMPVEGIRRYSWVGVCLALTISSLFFLGKFAWSLIPDGQSARPANSLGSRSPVNPRELQPAFPMSPGTTGLGESRDVDPATEWTGDDLTPLQQEFDDWHRRSQKLWE